MKAKSKQNAQQPLEIIIKQIKRVGIIHAKPNELCPGGRQNAK